LAIEAFMQSCIRSRPDTSTAVAFLTTPLKGPDRDDYNKLTRFMRFLMSNILTLNFMEITVQEIKWWLDASFATHPDIQSHTGGVKMVEMAWHIHHPSDNKLTLKAQQGQRLVGVSDLI